MEEFFDEKILEYRRHARNEKYSTLETGMYIKMSWCGLRGRRCFREN